MISNGEKLREARSEGRCHYLAVSKRSALSREISSIRGITKYHGNSYSLNCFHTFEKKKKHRSNNRLCENKDSCNIIMPSEDTKILEFNQYQKSDKAPIIIYADLECLIEKIDGY